jgi:hypothetical protein
MRRGWVVASISIHTYLSIHPSIISNAKAAEKAVTNGSKGPAPSQGCRAPARARRRPGSNGRASVPGRIAVPGRLAPRVPPAGWRAVVPHPHPPPRTIPYVYGGRGVGLDAGGGGGGGSNPPSPQILWVGSCPAASADELQSCRPWSGRCLRACVPVFVRVSVSARQSGVGWASEVCVCVAHTAAAGAVHGALRGAAGVREGLRPGRGPGARLRGGAGRRRRGGAQEDVRPLLSSPGAVAARARPARARPARQDVCVRNVKGEGDRAGA